MAGGADTTAAINELLYPFLKLAPGEIVNTQFLWLDLTQPNTINIPALPFPLPGALLIVAAAIQFISAKITAPYAEAQDRVAKSTPQKSDDMQATIQKSMIYTFPAITIIIGLRFPAGLAIYWLVFSAIQAYQQYRSTGWGGLTPWMNRAGLLKSEKQSK